jgi:hypothetical protein
MDLCPSKKLERSGENLTVLSEIAFSFPLSSAGFSMFNPLPELSLSHPPLTAYLKGGQLETWSNAAASSSVSKRILSNFWSIELKKLPAAPNAMEVPFTLAG